MDHELLVIGGGAAGMAAARAGVRAGRRTLLVTEGPIGGDCTFTGCVPSKTLLAAAAEGERFGPAMRRVRETVARIAATEDAEVFAREGVDVRTASARFTGPRTVRIDGREHRPAHVVIATGAGPAVPPIPGLAEAEYLTNENVFDLTEPPASLAVLGGGPLGCELAQAFARLGVTVTVLDAAPRLLPGEEPEAGQIVTRVFERSGIAVRTGVSVQRVDRDAGGVALSLADGSVVRAERLLVATGRQPYTGGLDPDAGGVALDDRGHVRVDEHLRTTADGVYAAGDVTGLAPFTHAAYEMGRLAVGNAGRRLRRQRFVASRIPRVTYTDPQVAAVGTSVADAAGRGARTARLPLDELDRAVTEDRTDGFVLLVAGPRSVLRNLGGGQVLGGTIVAPQAGEMIAEVALAIRTGMFVGRLAQTSHAYPTWTLGVQQAAARFFGVGGTSRPAE